jgi:hypothetical protein
MLVPSGRGASIVWNGLWRELRKAITTIRFTNLPKDGMKGSTTYYQAWEYFLGVMLLSAYRQFEQRVGYVTSAKGTKTAIVLDAINKGKGNGKGRKS